MSLWLPIGHSLGASRVNAIVARAVSDAILPVGGIKFGEPNTGFGRFNDLLRKLPWPNFPSYKNVYESGHDSVTDLPEFVPLAFPYEAPYERTIISAAPWSADPDLLFKYHHAELYQAGILKLNPLPVIGNVTPMDAINLIVAQYNDPTSVTWDFYDDGPDDGIVWGMKVVNGTMVFSFRGSKTLEDFRRDGEFFWQNDRDIGPIELGFNAGMHYVWAEMQKFIS